MQKIKITIETREDLISMGFSRQAAWRCLKQGWYTVPKRRNFLAIWDVIDPAFIYKKARQIAWNPENRQEEENIFDDLVTYAYKVNLGGIEHPKAYLSALLRSRLKDYKKRMEYENIYGERNLEQFA